jgi:hypothetical protein
MKISKEVLNFPFNGNLDDKKNFLSDIVCKKMLIIINKAKIDRITMIWFFVFMTVFSKVNHCEAISSSRLLDIRPILYINSHQKISTNPILKKRVDKIYLIPNEKIVLLIYLNSEQIYINQEILKKLHKLKGGDLTPNLVMFALGGIIFILLLGSDVDSFIILKNIGKMNAPTIDFTYGSNPTYQPTQSRSGTEFRLQIARPTEMPHLEFVGLSSQDRRNLPNSNDMSINRDGYPELKVGFNQAKYKVRGHGALHGLPYKIKSNGRTKTERTDENALKMMQSIVNMPNRDNVVLFKEATYQGNTDRQFEAIFIYDLDEKIIAVFKKSTRMFVTTCQLDDDEDTELLDTGNFGGDKNWHSGQVRNLPPRPNVETPLNSFENDVMQITPMNQITENSSLTGFTPINSFESDVTGITPLDNSQVDEP